MKRELETFEYEKTPSGNIVYSAPKGYFDDCVISLALAAWGLRSSERREIPRTIWSIHPIGGAEGASETELMRIARFQREKV